MAKEIHINIGEEGEITIKAEGYSGDECLKATEPFERALGRKKSQDLTPEFFETPIQQQEEDQVKV